MEVFLTLTNDNKFSINMVGDGLGLSMQTDNTALEAILVPLLEGPPGGGSSIPVRRYDEVGNYQYVGLAPEGSADGDAVWTISRLAYSSGTFVNTTYAINVTWTGRLGHVYT